MRADDLLIELAERQHWLVSRSDVAKAMTSRQWCRRLDADAWREVAPGVWCHRATVIDWRLQARAGLRSLGHDAALFGRTAAAWWELMPAPRRVEFVVPRSRSSRTFPFVLHSTKQWHTRDLLTVDGLRVTSATRTAIDLAGDGCTAHEVEAVIDLAIGRRLTSLPTLERRVGQLGGSGRVGSTLLRALLLDSGGESYLERRFLRLVRSAGLPRPNCQVVHRSDGKRVARVDFQFPATNVIVEVSGRLGHVSDADRERDARRRNGLQHSGHIVLEFTTAHVLDDPGYIITTLQRELPARATR